MFTRLRNLISVHRAVYLAVRASPNECMQTLIEAARPSTQRLQHRNLFSEGRRYSIQAKSDGFRMMTTSKVNWNQRRTRPSALLSAGYSRVDSNITRITLYTRIRLSRTAEALFIPTFMASILIYVAWPLPLILFSIAALYSVSISLSFYTAKIEANEMVFFVKRVLEELEPADILELSASVPYFHSDSPSPREFAKEWEKFYRRHQN